MSEKEKKSNVKKAVIAKKKEVKETTDKIVKNTKKVVKQNIKSSIKPIEKIADEIEKEVTKKFKKENKFVLFLKNNKTILIVLAVVAALVIGTIFTEGNKEEEPAGETIQTWYNTTLESDYTVTVIAMSTCGYCANYKPIITALSEEKGFKLEWFEIDTLSSSDQKILTTTYELENYSGGVPYTFITYGGEFVKDNVGYMEEEDTINFLTKAGVLN